MANNNDFVCGCPDPFSVAEFVSGKSINWSKEKDDLDTVAKCFGITKQGFMRNATALLNPQVTVDSKGKKLVLSKEEARLKLDEILKKNARALKSTKTVSKKNNSKNVSITDQKREKVVDLLLKKELDLPKLKQNVEIFEEKVGSNDEVFLPSGMKWQDKGYFFNEIVDWRDVCQNGIGDCYFLAALCSIAYVNPFLIKNVTAFRGKWNEGAGSIEKESPWHAIDFYVPDGTSEASVAWSDKKKTVQTIVTSEEVLVKSNGLNYGVCGQKEKQCLLKGNLLPTTKADRDSCWAAVYEKAFSKFLEKSTSDYPNMLSAGDARKNGKTGALIHGGRASAALKILLHSEQVTVKKLDSMSENQIWQWAVSASENPSCASIHGETKEENGTKVSYGKAGTEEYYLERGLHISHVYSVLNGYACNGKKYVVLRNPHGKNNSNLKNNSKVYHGNWKYSTGYNVMDSYRGLLDIYKEVEGNDDPYNSNGVFLLEIAEFKRLFHDVSYYSGPSLTYGYTNLVSEEPVRFVEVTNKIMLLDFAKSASVKLECIEPGSAEIVSLPAFLILMANGKTTIDLSQKKIKDRSKVRVVVLSSMNALENRTYYSRYFYYHKSASKTIHYECTLGSIIEL